MPKDLMSNLINARLHLISLFVTGHMVFKVDQTSLSKLGDFFLDDLPVRFV